MKKVAGDLFWGLDVGTDSVGWAITDTSYNLIKYKGEPLWGSHVFESGKTKAERRAFRTARRRIARKKQRIFLTQEIFAPEIAKIDEQFFVRIKEGGLWREDTSIGSQYNLFEDVIFTDQDYHKAYPTIHHLICDLMSTTESRDVRLVYLACAWLMKHRGHFLSEVDKENIENLTDFVPIYQSFLDAVHEYAEAAASETLQVVFPDVDSATMQEILRKKISVTKKEALFKEKVNGGKKFAVKEDDIFDLGKIFKLLSGGKVKPKDVFRKDEYSEVESLALSAPEDTFEKVLSELEEMDGELLRKLRNMYDWSILVDTLGGCKSISESKVRVYEQHAQDLQWLKEFVKKYTPEKKEKIFISAKQKDNYAAYIGKSEEKMCNQGEFCAFLKKQINAVEVMEEDAVVYASALERIELGSFMPKQVTGDNRVIPYQLYYHELKSILNNAAEYLPFLEKRDQEGYRNMDKLLSIFTFRIPYYVGPLRKDNSSYAWIERKAEGKIYPWNFARLVDEDKSEEAFINRMTNTCTYLPGRDVLPINSLLYKKFTVLNEINTIRVNGEKIPVACKQEIYHEFECRKTVSVKRVREILISNGIFRAGDQLSGLDQGLTKMKSSLTSYHSFKKLLQAEILTEEQVDEIIARSTYAQDKVRMSRWLRQQYEHLADEDVAYISRLKFTDFGRLSKEFLTGLLGANKATGEIQTIMQTLWTTNDNLMEICSDRYTFFEEIQRIKAEEYAGKDVRESLDELLDELYISNSVRRPIYRTLSILDDVQKATGKAPKRIFIEMARGGGEKGKRTVKRRDKITDLFKNVSMEEKRELSHQLDGVTDNELQSERLYLYFMQMGRCMYSGEAIDLQQLKTDKYDVDHIYPQCFIKDDSLSNKVLVLKTLNGINGNSYPIPNEVCERCRMMGIWTSLKNNGMMSEEKYRRLIRRTEFGEEEKQGFINRQLVETRQSTKALAEILQRMYPETEIVYVKAGLVSDFRKEYDLLKCRSVNDLHHGKDAYLNIVCGNVYHCRFTKNFDVTREYSLKTKTLFGQNVRENGEIIWHGHDGEDLKRVKRIVEKNNLHYTRFAFARKGSLFDQMPVQKGKGAVSRKRGLPIEKYGGYNKSTSSFFVLVQYAELAEKGKKKNDNVDVMFMPVDLCCAAEVMQSEDNLFQYARKNIASILGKDEAAILIKGLPLGMKKLRVNTKIVADGLSLCITGKANEGRVVGCTVMLPLVLKAETEQYIKVLERTWEKMSNRIITRIDDVYDNITAAQNLSLYNTVLEKLKNGPYGQAFSKMITVLSSGREKFEQLSLEEQIPVLLSAVALLKTGRSTGCDLRSIGGVGQSGVFVMSSKLSNWQKKFKTVYVIDESASGIYSQRSTNLLEYL